MVICDISGIDVDCLGGRVYWSDITGKTIKSSNYDGTDVQNFLTTGISALSLVCREEIKYINKLGAAPT